MASRLADTGHHQAELWGAAMKAHGVDGSDSTAAELALLLGAGRFHADSTTAKTRRDLGGLLYADGIHDCLYRAAGKQHLRQRGQPDPGAAPGTKARHDDLPMTA